MQQMAAFRRSGGQQSYGLRLKVDLFELVEAIAYVSVQPEYSLLNSLHPYMSHS